MNLYKEFANKELKRKKIHDSIANEMQATQQEKLENEVRRQQKQKEDEEAAALQKLQQPDPKPKPKTRKPEKPRKKHKAAEDDDDKKEEVESAETEGGDGADPETPKAKEKPRKLRKHTVKKAYGAGDSVGSVLVDESLIGKVKSPAVKPPAITTMDRSMNAFNNSHMDELCKKVVGGTLDVVKDNCLMYWKIFRARNMRKIITLWSAMNIRSCLRCHPSTDGKDGQGIQSILYNMRDNTMMISLFDEKYIQTNQLYYCSHVLNIAIQSNQVQVHLSSKKDDNEFVLVWIILKQYSNRLCVLCVDKNNNIVDSIYTVVHNANEFGTDLITTPLNTLTQYVSRISPSVKGVSTTCLISMRTDSKDINSRLRTLEQGNIQTVYFALKEGMSRGEKAARGVKFDIYGVSQDSSSLHTIIFNDGQIKYIMCPSRAPENDNEFNTKLFEVMSLKHINFVLSLLPFSIKSIVTFINMSISKEIMLSIKYNVTDSLALDNLVKYFVSNDETQKPYDAQLVRETIKKVIDIYLCLTYEIVDLGSFHYIIRHAVL